MSKITKIVIGVVVIAALVVGGLYFSGVVGDGGQGFLKKKDFTIDYDYGLKKKLKPTEEGISNLKVKPDSKLKNPIKAPKVDLSPAPLPTAPATVPDYYANALEDFDIKHIKDLWDAGVPSDYATALQEKFEAQAIIWLWEAGVSSDYAIALWNKFRESQIEQLWEDGIPLWYLLKISNLCRYMDPAEIKRQYENGVDAEDLQC